MVDNILIKKLSYKDAYDINKLQERRGYATIKPDFLLGNDCDWVVYGAYNGDNIVAMCCFFKYRRIPHEDYPNGYVAEIGGAYVLPEYRNRGIMSKLIETMLQNTKEDLFLCDAIVADATDAAYSIYKKMGFVDSVEHRIWRKL